MKIPVNLWRRYTAKRRGLISLDKPAVKDEDLSFSRRKNKTFHQLTLQQKVDIAGDVFLEKSSRDEIAHKYCVSKRLITTLLGNLKKNKNYLEEMIQQYYAKEEKQQ